MSALEIPSPSLITEIDMELMLLIIQGHTSSYSVWSYSKNNKTTYIKPVAYKNINQRFLRLARLKLLEELQLNEKDKNPHRKIAYKLTSYGLYRLIPFITANPDIIQTIFQYIDKFKLDKQWFGSLLLDKYISTSKAMNECLKYVDIKIRIIGLGKITNEIMNKMDQAAIEKEVKTGKKHFKSDLKLIDLDKYKIQEIKPSL